MRREAGALPHRWSLWPEEREQRGNERQPDESRSDGKAAERSRQKRTTALGGEERRRCERKKQAVRVDRGKDVCDRVQRGVEDRITGDALSHGRASDVRQGGRGDGSRGERDKDSRDQRRAHDHREAVDHERIDRKEGGDLLAVIAVVRDVDEPHGIPLREGSEDQIRDGFVGAERWDRPAPWSGAHRRVSATPIHTPVRSATRTNA
jgi:hypothetical protein